MNSSGSSATHIIEALEILKSEFSTELHDLLDFWSSSCIDQKRGGFIGSMDHFGFVDPDARKGCILNTRILWTFSAAFRFSENPSYKIMAQRAYHYLKEYFWDSDNGGLYWEVDAHGGTVNSKKQAYVQGFGIYAFSEYYRATGDVKSLEFAKNLFHILEDKFWESKYGGYIEALSNRWEVLDDMRLSDKDLNTPKSMNTHLHILEPYTNLYRVWPNSKLKAAIQSILHIFCEKIYNPETKHLDLFFGLDWTSQFQEISFGHDIEAAWLMNEASMAINKGELDEDIHKITKILVDVTMKEGIDTDGSLFYELNGQEMDTDKHWWPQAEAMVGFLDAYQFEKNTDYLQQVHKLWIFIQKHLKDPVNGEWYWRVDQNNQAYSSEVKAGFWKCPYHNGRALMEMIERIEKIKKYD